MNTTAQVLMLKDLRPQHTLSGDVPNGEYEEHCDHCGGLFRTVASHWSKADGADCRTKERIAEKRLCSSARSSYPKKRRRNTTESSPPHTPHSISNSFEQPPYHPEIDPSEALASGSHTTENQDPNIHSLFRQLGEASLDDYDEAKEETLAEFRFRTPSPEQEDCERGASPLSNEIELDSSTSPHGHPTLLHPLPNSESEAFSEGLTIPFPEEYRPAQPIIDPSTGKVEQYLTPHEVWWRDFLANRPDTDPRWAPCSNEIEWCLIRWAQKEHIGKGSLDKLLALPGVSVIYFIESEIYFLCSFSMFHTAQG